MVRFIGNSRLDRLSRGCEAKKKQTLYTKKQKEICKKMFQSDQSVHFKHGYLIAKNTEKLFSDKIM